MCKGGGGVKTWWLQGSTYHGLVAVEPQLRPVAYPRKLSHRSSYGNGRAGRENASHSRQDRSLNRIVRRVDGFD